MKGNLRRQASRSFASKHWDGEISLTTGIHIELTLNAANGCAAGIHSRQFMNACRLFRLIGRYIHSDCDRTDDRHLCLSQPLVNYHKVHCSLSFLYHPTAAFNCPYFPGVEVDRFIVSARDGVVLFIVGFLRADGWFFQNYK